MALKDLKSNIHVVPSIDPGAQGATTQGADISIAGFNAVVVAFATGAIGGSLTPSLEESDDGAGGWTAVDAEDIIGDVSALTANTTRHIGYKGMKSHIRPVLTVGGAGGDAAVVGVLGHATHAPAGEPDADQIRIT